MISNQKQNPIAALFRHQIVIPIAALLLLTIFNVLRDTSFFEVTLKNNSAGNPVLAGNLISVLDNGSELAILAIGMTLVTAACGGQDISVGATAVIAGSVVMRILSGGEASADVVHAPIIIAFLVCCLAAMACGAFNGMMVSVFRIQPMVATLIMFTAGRSIAGWINENKSIAITDPNFAIAGTFIPGIPVPTPVFIALICFIITWAILKFTNLGLYVQAVGINEKTSRLNGLNPTLIKFGTFVLLGLCVAVVGFIKVSRNGTINYSVVAKDIEMDAILAVALGGNALSGGKFNMPASILGAYVIQYLTTTLYAMEVQATALPAYKAVVVIALVVLSAPKVRDSVSGLFRKMSPAKQSGGAA
ncbi:MAG: ABC transporter permease [Oscillospiraceae bacterium]|nr:ABC transporter permease [Oscillospiraceae bacterium]